MNYFSEEIAGIISRKKKIISDFLIACGIGLACGIVCLSALILRHYSASDFQFPLKAARALIIGSNPYSSVVPTDKYPFDQYFYYPIMAAIFSIPFTVLPDQLAGATFIGVTSGLLAYSLAKKDRWRLALFLSAPAFVTIYTAQWSFLIAACLMIPEFQIFLLCKPNIGIAALLHQPTIKGAISIIVGIFISLIILPTWIPDWLGTLSYTAQFHYPPAFSILIVFLFFCLLRYKSPEGRLLIMMLIAPQAMFFYDQLLLWFVPKRPIELWLLNLVSWVGYFLWRIQLRGLPDNGQYVPSAYPYVLWCIYFPAILILLLPNLQKIRRIRLFKSKQISDFN